MFMKKFFVESKIMEVAPGDYLNMAKEQIFADFGRLLSCAVCSTLICPTTPIPWPG